MKSARARSGIFHSGVHALRCSVFRSEKNMRIVVIDGMGGGLGAQIVTRVRPLARDPHEVLALGTNAIATAAMVKAGASVGATGENAILVNVPRADLILGPIGVAIPHSLMGGITPPMA